MAFGLMTALKVIPWGDVLEAAPHILKGAKHLISGKKSVEDVFVADPAGSHAVAGVEERLHLLQLKAALLETEQKASATLIRSLAEQNARVVEAIEVLRIRTRTLVLLCALESITLIALVAWLMLR